MRQGVVDQQALGATGFVTFVRFMGELRGMAVLAVRPGRRLHADDGAVLDPVNTAAP